MDYETKKKLANALKLFNLDMFDEDGYVDEVALDALVEMVLKFAPKADA